MDDPRTSTWVQTFLRGAGGNPELAAALAEGGWRLREPVAFPLGRLVRCCGPEPGMAYRDPPESWRRRIARMSADLRRGWQAPPLIAGAFGDWDMVLMDGNHRHAALRAVGRATHPVIFVSPSG